jgi:hypothetical protein
MTSWHAEDNLEDAFEFANSAVPAEAYIEKCRDFLVVTVANPAWAASVVRMLKPTI